MHPSTRVFRLSLATLMAAGATACSAVTAVTKTAPSAPRATLQPIAVPASSQPSTPFASSNPSSFDVGIYPRAIAVADLNADSRLDVVVANSRDETLTILLGTGDERLLGSPWSVRAGQEPSDVEDTEDERDQIIDLRGTKITYLVYSIGNLLSMLTFVFGQPPLVMFTLLILSGVVAQIIGDISRLYLYRRGF